MIMMIMMDDDVVVVVVVVVDDDDDLDNDDRLEFDGPPERNQDWHTVVTVFPYHLRSSDYD